MKRRVVLFSVLLGACGGARQAPVEPRPAAPAAATSEPGRLPGEQVLDPRPAIPPLGAFTAPVPRELTLENGLRLVIVERAGAPIEALALVVRRGSSFDPAGKAGLASITAAMLETGAAKKTQAQLAQQADAMGAALRTGADPDAITLSISAPPARLEPMASLLADIVLRPTFDPAEWKKLQAQRVAQLTEGLANPRVAAANAFAAAIYFDGPLGHPAEGTPGTVQALKLDDLRRLWSGVGPADATLIAVGAASAGEVQKLASSLFGGWKTRAVAAAVKTPVPGWPPVIRSALRRPRLVLVELPGRPQTVLRVGQPSVPLASPDAMALRLLNSVLGGSFTSRLNANLREKNGFTYGAGSQFSFGRGDGPFFASTSVKTEVTGLALREILHELQRIIDEPLSTADLDKGKALLAYRLVDDLQTAEGTASLVGELVASGVGLDWLSTVLPRLQALTAADVQAAGQRALDPATMTVTVAGDPGVLAQLAQAGVTMPAPERRTATGAKR